MSRSDSTGTGFVRLKFISKQYKNSYKNIYLKNTCVRFCMLMLHLNL